MRRFRKGEILFEEGQPAESVSLIKRGWVHLAKRTLQGTPVTIFTVTPEEVLCGFSAVVGQRVYYASAVAATDTTAIRISHMGNVDPNALLDETQRLDHFLTRQGHGRGSPDTSSAARDPNAKLTEPLSLLQKHSHPDADHIPSNSGCHRMCLADAKGIRTGRH